MGSETSVVIALLFAGFLMVAVVVYSSIDYYSNLVENAQYERDVFRKEWMQTDIIITNVTNNSMNLTLKNTGKTTLNASYLNIFINGNYSSKNVTSGTTWAPQYSTNITIPVKLKMNDRIKITTENGIAAYALVTR